jgi:hypothetical protein
VRRPKGNGDCNRGGEREQRRDQVPFQMPFAKHGATVKTSDEPPMTAPHRLVI